MTSDTVLKYLKKFRTVDRSKLVELQINSKIRNSGLIQAKRCPTNIARNYFSDGVVRQLSSFLSEVGDEETIDFFQESTGRYFTGVNGTRLRKTYFSAWCFREEGGGREGVGNKKFCHYCSSKYVVHLTATKKPWNPLRPAE